MKFISLLQKKSGLLQLNHSTHQPGHTKRLFSMFILIFFILFTTANIVICQPKNLSEIIPTVKSDYKQFYSQDRLIRMGITFCGGAGLAFSSADKNFNHWYQSNVRDSDTDRVSKKFKLFGEGKLMIPISLATAVAGSIVFPEGKMSFLGEWGKLTARSYLTGAPALLLMQRLTGGSRPKEREYGSKWKPLKDDNGVSGHAFVGAVPFLTLSLIAKKNKPVRYILCTASIFPALSRINDNKHYLSQALLGWYMAWETVSAIEASNHDLDRIILTPYFNSNGYGILLSKKW